MFIDQRTSIKCLIIILTSVLWCEWLYYHYIIRVKCNGWPEGGVNATNILVISDTHVMGSHKSYRIDKWRREWEMHQSYQMSTEFFKPDVIINLGDLIDEGAIYDANNFKSSVEDYKRIFKSSYVNFLAVNVPGNHDMGHHDHVTNYPLFIGRFSQEFNTTQLLDIIKINANITLVIINSMLFYDNCPYCRMAYERLGQISKHLGEDGTIKPILLTHIPLYRPDESLCDRPIDLSQYKNRWEGFEVIGRRQSKLLLELLTPRLILSGHSHKNCKINHEIYSSGSFKSIYEEITLTSYNHKFDDAPKYLLISANSTHTLTNHCGLISEYHILTVYLASLVIIFMMIYHHNFDRHNH